MHRLAIIDVGTHSILLLIAETNINGNIVPIHQEIRSVRLGKSVDRDGIIQNEPLTETILVLNQFKDLAMNRKAERIVVVGTQVLRSAKNRDFVRATIKQKTGLDIEMLHQKDGGLYSFRFEGHDFIHSKTRCNTHWRRGHGHNIGGAIPGNEAL